MQWCWCSAENTVRYYEPCLQLSNVSDPKEDQGEQTNHPEVRCRLGTNPSVYLSMLVSAPKQSWHLALLYTLWGLITHLSALCLLKHIAALNQFGSRQAGQITALQFVQIQSSWESQNSHWSRLVVGGALHHLMTPSPYWALIYTVKPCWVCIIY